MSEAPNEYDIIGSFRLLGNEFIMEGHIGLLERLQSSLPGDLDR